MSSDKLIKNLYQHPQKDKGKEKSVWSGHIENGSHQLDLLFMPNDDGYKYILTVVDVATRKIDARPLKSKDSAKAWKAYKSILNGDILGKSDEVGKMKIHVDNGSEFKGDFYKSAMKYGLWVVKNVPGRHRQQGLVEAQNKRLAKALFKNMTAREILTGKKNKEWVDELKGVVKKLNKKRVPPKQLNINAPPHWGRDVLPLGTKVRVQLDNPRSADANAEKYKGGFRVTDIRWDPQPSEISNYWIRPDRPVMYNLDGNDTIAYTRNQLQVIPKNEKMPSKKKYLKRK